MHKGTLTFNSDVLYPKTSADMVTYSDGTVADALQNISASKSPIDSPNFTGTPTAPTPAIDDDSTKIATTAYCASLIRRLVGTAPETLDTLVELAAAINNDPDFKDTIIQALDGKVNKTVTLQTNLASTASTNLNGSSASIGVTGILPIANGGTGKNELSNVSVGYATTAGSCTGNAATATSASKVTGGTVTLTGNVTGSASFGSNGNVSIATAANYATSAGSATTAGSCTGNAATATSASKVTGGTITLTGDVTGSASFGSNGNVSIAATAVKNNIFNATNAGNTADLNTLTDLGFYTIYPQDADTQHAPISGSRIYLMVIGTGTSRVQVAWAWTGAKMWVRGSTNITAANNWGIWHAATFTS